MTNLNDITRKFMLNEGVVDPDIQSHIRIIIEILHNMMPSTLREKQRLSIINQHMMEIRRKSRKMQEELTMLEERVKILEESEKVMKNKKKR